ncbi:MAG: HEAT repeat domain-containing protein [Deltaproteobacteria bacterium]
MALLIVKLIIWSICVFIIGTLFVVMVRRLYMQRRYLVLDSERVRCAHVFEAVAGGEMPDRSVHLRPPGSPGWIAMEEALFKALDAGANRALVLRWFDDLGYVDQYIYCLTRSKNRWDKALAAKKLGLIKCARAVPSLTGVLGADYRDTRNMAIFALGLILDKATIPNLIGALRDSVRNDEEVSIRVVKSSILAFGADALPYLIQEARNPLWKARAAVVDILVELAFPAVADTFIGLLEDTEQDVRAKACKGLGKIRCAEATARLIKATQDPFWVVRLHAVKALGLIGDPFSVEFIGARLEDQNWQVRKTAAEALGVIGRCAYAVLLDVYLKSTDSYAREQAADELERAGVMSGFMDYAISIDLMAQGLGASDPLAQGSTASSPVQTQGTLMPPGVYLSIAVVLGSYKPYRVREALEAFSSGEYTPQQLDQVMSGLIKIRDLGG